MSGKNKPNPAAKIVFLLLAIVIMAVLALWAASAIFMAWHGAPIEQATPTMIFKYWEIYGQNEQYQASFLAAFGIPFTILFGVPLILWLMNTDRRSLHGDAQWAKPVDIRKMGLFEGNSTSLLVGKYKGMFPEEEKKIRESWVRAFDIDNWSPFAVSGNLWEIKEEWVKKIVHEGERIPEDDEVL